MVVVAHGKPADWADALNDFTRSELRSRLPAAANPDDVSVYIRPFTASGTFDPVGAVMTTSITWEMDGEFVAGAMAVNRLRLGEGENTVLVWHREFCALVHDMVRHERRRWEHLTAYQGRTRADFRTRHELNCRDWGPNYRLEQDSSQTL